jgi:hypothetical protein
VGNPFDVERIREYGGTVPAEFGGVFVEMGTTVVLFTQHLDAHRTALDALLATPGLVEVRPARRTWRDLEAAQQRVVGLLITPHRHPAIYGVGLSLEEGQFVVMVIVDVGQPEAADQVRALCDPEQLWIRLARGPSRRSLSVDSLIDSSSGGWLT